MSSVPPDFHERLIQLETTLAFQDQLLSELNSLVLRQQRELDRLGKQLLSLQRRLSKSDDQAEEE